MSCGCAGLCCDEMPDRNLMLTGSFGLHDPSMAGYKMEPHTHHRNHGVIKSGLGDTCIDYDYDGNCIGTVPTYQDPTETPYPVVFSNPPTSTTAPAGSANKPLSFLEQLALSWGATGQQILKAQSGALPTYQNVGPGGQTTVYGNTTGIPSLASSIGSSSNILLLGGAALLLLLMSKK